MHFPLRRAILRVLPLSKDMLHVIALECNDHLRFDSKGIDEVNE